MHNHLWKLPIPAFERSNELHVAISKAGKAAAASGAARQLAKLRLEREDLTVTIARRELRKWLRGSRQGKTVEANVKKLLGRVAWTLAPPSRPMAKRR